MCSNYDACTKPERLRMYFGVEPPPRIKSQVWPLYEAPFIRRHPHKDVGDEAVPAREAVAGLFGLLPHWAGEMTFGRRTYNARSETVAEKPSFREAWRNGQHCVVPVEHIYEPDWRGGTSMPTRIQRKDGKPMGIAGLWASNTKATGEELFSFTMLTVNADEHELFQHFHKPGDEKRMVVILHEEQYDEWLGAPAARSMDFMRQYPAGVADGYCRAGSRKAWGVIFRPSASPSTSLFPLFPLFPDFQEKTGIEKNLPQLTLKTKEITPIQPVTNSTLAVVMATKVAIHPAGQSGPFEVSSSVLPTQTIRFTITITKPDGSLLFPPLTEDLATDVYSLVHVTAEAIAAEKSFSYGSDNQPYLWNGRNWENANTWLLSVSASMHARIRSGEFRSKSSACFYNTMHALWLASGRKDLELKPFGRCRGIPLEDGVLELNEEGIPDLAPHTPENQNLHYLPVKVQDVVDEYFELSSGRRNDSLLLQFLRSSLDEDQQKVLQRWFGLHLVVHRVGNPEKLLYMYGPGGNGKSMVVAMLTTLLTENAVAVLRLDDLTIPSNLELLVGKMAMIGSEGRAETDNERLKNIVSWEALTVNPKYRDPFLLRPQCLVTQASNPRPEFDDDSDAMVRRVIVLHMTYKPDSNEKVLDIAGKVRGKEYALLVAWALLGAAEVVQAGTIEIPESVARVSEKTVRPVRAIDRFVELLEYGQYEIAEDELYAAFTIFSKKQGLGIVPKAEFSEGIALRLKRAGRHHLRRTKATGYSPQSYVNDIGKVMLFAPGVEKARSTNLLLGLRISEGEFGGPVGQEIPALRREVPLF